MDLPPPEVPAPGAVENMLRSLSENAGLFAGLAIAAVFGFVVARQRKLLETKSASRSLAPTP